MAPPADLDGRRADDPARLPPPSDCGADLLAMVADAGWVHRQYDHQLFLNTVEGPGGDAAVLLLKGPGVPAGSKRALALTTDGNHRWCAVDPRAGTAMVVAEATLNVACAGARPLALVNCLNFGNPEHPEVMWQFSEAVDGMAEACRVLNLPVVGGNVSFYNESQGRDIDPTPVVGVVGLIDELVRRPPGVGLVDGTEVLLLGATRPNLAGSRWAVERHRHRGGVLPDLDLVAHADLLELVAGIVHDGLAGGIHDVSEGGLAVALAEMAARTAVGVDVPAHAVPSHAELFSESSSRVVVCVAAGDVDQVERRAVAAGVPVSRVGRAGGDRLRLGTLVDLSTADLIAAWRNAIPSALAV